MLDKLGMCPFDRAACAGLQFIYKGAFARPTFLGKWMYDLLGMFASLATVAAGPPRELSKLAALKIAEYVMEDLQELPIDATSEDVLRWVQACTALKLIEHPEHGEVQARVAEHAR